MAALPTVAPSLSFANPAGELLTHPHGYAVLRYRVGSSNVAALAELLTQTGALLVAHGWYRLLSNALELPALPTAAKTWMVDYWLAGRIARPQRVLVAVVQPAAVLARLSISEMQSQAQGLTTYHPFATEPEAHAFLAAQQP